MARIPTVVVFLGLMLIPLGIAALVDLVSGRCG